MIVLVNNSPFSEVIIILTFITVLWAYLVAQMVKNLPVMWKTQVPSLAGDDPLEKGMATHSSILV